MELKTKFKTTTKNYQASIQNLKEKFDRLADKQYGRPSGSLPSNTQPNLKGSSSKPYQLPQAQNEHVNAVFTRSGKSYVPTDNPNDQQNDSETPISFDSADEKEESTPQPIDVNALLDEGSEILNSIEGTILPMQCMLAIFHDMIKESVEVFMDDFSVFRNSFENCLNNLDKMLQRCKDANLVLSWEKYYFMVKEGILLGRNVSDAGLEVDKRKIYVISKLPPPTNVKGIRSFLGHVGFYRRFIKDFSKISRPLTKFLEKDTPFKFDDECHKAFNSLKEKLTCTPVIVSPNWNLPFELMCDASEFAIGAVLGQKHFHLIYFASKTLNAAQQKYTVTKKELLAVIDNDETGDDSDVDDNFPGETLMEITTKDTPWFADFANYLVMEDSRRLA
ncbi:reverse transcriptase domain-containing protein [Tanacetum coccineum]